MNVFGMTGRRGLATLAAVLSILLTLAACGGSADDAAAPATKIAGLDGVLALSVPYLMTTDEYNQGDLDLEFLNVGASSPNAVAALLSGDADFATVSLATIVDYAAKADDLRIVGSVVDLSGGLVLSKQALAKLNLPAGADAATKVQALKGLKIATGPEGGGAIIDLRRLLSGHGVDPAADLTISPVAELPAMVAGVRQGVFDGAYYNLPSILSLVSSGTGDVVLSRSSGELDDVLKPGVGAVVITRASTVEQKPDLVAKVYERLNRVLADVHTQPDRFASVLRKDYVPKLSDADFALSWDEVLATIPPDGRFTQDDFATGVADSRNDTSRVTYQGLVYTGAQA